MAAYNPKIFTKPDGLKRIANAHLIALLDPWRTYFAGRGLQVPVDPAAEFPHAELSALLMTYDADMPLDLMNGLYYIDETASTETLDELLERANDTGIHIERAGKPTAADVAVQIWLANPKLLEERVVRSLAFQKSSFTYYTGAMKTKRAVPGVSDSQKAEIAALMDPVFEKRHRGRGTRIFAFPREDKVWFLVRHGMPMTREGKHEEDGEAGVAFYRPQKHDVLIYDGALDMLGVNAGSKWESTLYRETFGQILFGDLTYFSEGDVFTLDPLRQHGPAVLACEDVEGITRVCLLEVVRVVKGGGVSRIEKLISTDLFASFGDDWNRSLRIGRITSAKFGFVFDGSSKQRAANIRLANVARYDRDSDSSMIEAWLQARGFYAVEEEDLVDADDPLLEGV